VLVECAIPRYVRAVYRTFEDEELSLSQSQICQVRWQQARTSRRLITSLFQSSLQREISLLETKKRVDPKRDRRILKNLLIIKLIYY
jgi:hypothetical protein